MDNEQKRETLLTSEQGGYVNGGHLISEENKVPQSRNKDIPRMTWKSFTAMTTAMLLTGSLLLIALIWPGQGHSTTDRHTSHARSSSLLVQTPVGVIKGSYKTKEGHGYIAYKSVPFAKPPIGDLRFKRPQQLEHPSSLQNVINSDNYRPSCWSATKTWPNPRYSEDCLYLNIFVPDSTANTSSLPVMVWIHGGGFVAGSAFPEPWKMVAEGNVIVVMVNYRLGIFGFLTNLSDDLTSNNGLWDQYMAIKWVHDNIQHFNGDPSSITLFGESAGATSVGCHVLSPFTVDHFHKAILQSGAMTTPITRSPQMAMVKFSRLAGCSRAESTDLVNCIRNVNVSTILQYSKPEYYVSNRAQRQFDFIWMPVVDGEFIVDEPLKLLKNITYLKQIGVFSKDYIIGVLNNEGGLITTNFLNPIPLNELESVTFFEELRDELFTARYGENITMTDGIKNAINNFYTGSAIVNQSLNPTHVLDLAADILFTVPATEGALALTDNRVRTSGKTYFYHFDYCPESKPSEASCFVHGSEIPLEFPRANITDPVLAQLSNQFISHLTSFAKHSDPGWAEYEPESKRYLRISPSSDTRHNLYTYREQFWLKTIPCLIALSGTNAVHHSEMC